MTMTTNDNESTPLIPGIVTIVEVPTEAENDCGNESGSEYTDEFIISTPPIGIVSFMMESASSVMGQAEICVSVDQDTIEEDDHEKCTENDDDLYTEENVFVRYWKNDPAQRLAKVAIATMSSLFLLCISCSLLGINSLHYRGSSPKVIYFASKDYNDKAKKTKNIFTEDVDPGWSTKVRIDEKGNNIAGLSGLTANCNGNDALSGVKFRREVRRENCWSIFGHETCDYNDYAWIDTECAENQVAVIPYVDTKSEISRNSDVTLSGSLLSLERQSVECPQNGFLSELTFEKDWLNRFYYKFTCIRYDAERSDCIKADSDYHHAGSSMKEIINHQLYCPAGKSMVSWKAMSHNEQLKFEAECCDAIVLAPTKQPTDSPISKKTNPSIADVPSTTTTLDAHSDPNNSKPLICTATFDKSESHYEKILKKNPGCAMVALNDVKKKDHGPGLMICGNMNFHTVDLVALRVKIDPDSNFRNRGKSISWMLAGDAMTITYYMEDGLHGRSKTFEAEGRPLSEEIHSNGDVKNSIKSLKTEVKPFHELSIPSDCAELI